MVKRKVLFIYDDEEVPQFLEKELSRIPSWAVSFERSGKPPRQSGNHHYDLLILESKRGWPSNSEQIQDHQSSTHPFPIMIIPQALLKRNVKRFLDMAQAMMEDSQRQSRSGTRQNSHSTPQDPLLEDFVEKKLKEFVRKMKASQSRNLYTLLVREIERPLISLTLKETRSNQMQAANLLGMNRNTLRKKIKELKIPLKQD